MKQEDVPSLPHQIVRQLRHAGWFLHYKMGGRVGRRRVLMELSAQPGMLQRELQQRLDVQAGSLSELLAKMEADGVLRRDKSTDDGRNFVLSLTEQGRADAARVRSDYDRRVTEMTSCLTHSELEQLHALLDVMLTHWDGLEMDPVDAPQRETAEGE